MFYRKSNSPTFRVCINTFISFYKETLEGETSNYINTTAAYDKTDAIIALLKTSQDAVNCIRRTESILAGKGEYEKAWQFHAAGYIQMHIMRGRYRLWEVGIANNPDKEEIVRRN